jgi:hypothetical protein
MGGISIVSVGIIGTTFVKAYEGSVGGKVNGSRNIFEILLTPRLCPSIKYDTAKPNMRFVKKAPKSATFVICQITKFGILSLYSLKLGIFSATE